MEIDDFLRFIGSGGASTNTIAAYRADINSFADWLKTETDKDISDTSSADVSRYYRSLRRNKRSASSLARSASALRKFFAWEKKSGFIFADPTEGLKPVKVIRKTPVAANEDDVDKIIRVIDRKTSRGMRDLAMIELVISSGVNVTELTDIRLSDLDIAGKRISLGGSRAVTVGRRAFASLSNYLVNARPLILEDKDENGFLFLSLRGKKLSRQGFWKNLRYYARKAGVDSITPATLRHRYAVNMLLGGKSPEELSRSLGLKTASAVSEYVAIAGKTGRI